VITKQNNFRALQEVEFTWFLGRDIILQNKEACDLLQASLLTYA